MEKDNYQIRITGKMEIDGKLDDSKDFSMAFKRLAIKKTERIPNENGTYTYVYNLGNLDTVSIITEDKFITGKTKKQSQRLRNSLYYLSKELDQDEQEFYDKFMDKLVHPNNLEKVYNLMFN